MRSKRTEQAWLERILRAVAADNDVGPSPLMLVEWALQDYPDSARLWCLRGDLIQFGGTDGPTDEAPRSYERALKLDPARVEAKESLDAYYALNE